MQQHQRSIGRDSRAKGAAAAHRGSGKREARRHHAKDPQPAEATSRSHRGACLYHEGQAAKVTEEPIRPPVELHALRRWLPVHSERIRKKGTCQRKGGPHERAKEQAREDRRKPNTQPNGRLSLPVQKDCPSPIVDPRGGRKSGEGGCTGRRREKKDRKAQAQRRA